jgi:hypothetical protein
VVQGVEVRQGQPPVARGPAAQVNRRANGEVLLEFT